MPIDNDLFYFYFNCTGFKKFTLALRMLKRPSIPTFLNCRDAVSDLALHFLAKMKILVVKEVEREDVEFVCKVRTKLLS